MAGRTKKIEQVEIDGEPFVVERALPVFHAFSGVSEHTGEPFAITDDDLPVIADRTKKLIEKDLKIINIIGHRHAKNGKDEAEQPAPIGMWDNPRIGTTPTGKPAVVMDCYTHASKWEDAKKHPFRSPEFSLARKEIRAVSRLTRNPRMDELGSNLYFHSDDQLIRFSDDNDLDRPEDSAPTNDEPAGDMPGGDGMAANEEQSLLDEQLMATFIEQLLKEFPGLAAMRKTGAPTQAADPKPEEKFSGEKLETFAELKAAHDTLKAENAEMRSIVNGMLKEKEENECRKLLAPLERFSLDENVELAALMALKPEDRPKRIDYIKANYRTKTGQGEPLHLFQGAVPNIGKGEGRPAAKDILAHAQRTHKTFDEAERELMGNQTA